MTSEEIENIRRRYAAAPYLPTLGEARRSVTTLLGEVDRLTSLDEAAAARMLTRQVAQHERAEKAEAEVERLSRPRSVVMDERVAALEAEAAKLRAVVELMDQDTDDAGHLKVGDGRCIEMLASADIVAYREAKVALDAAGEVE